MEESLEEAAISAIGRIHREVDQGTITLKDTVPMKVGGDLFDFSPIRPSEGRYHNFYIFTLRKL